MNHFSGSLECPPVYLQMGLVQRYGDTLCHASHGGHSFTVHINNAASFSSCCFIACDLFLEDLEKSSFPGDQPPW